MITTLDRDLGVGLVGCGRAGSSLHLPAIARVPGLRAVAATDADRSRATAVAQADPTIRIHSSIDDLLCDSTVSIVAVCVPPAAHAGVAIAALGAGKHVYLEKPIGVSRDDATAIAAAAVRAPGTLTMGFNLRSHRLVREAAGILESGALGPIELVRASWTSGYHRGGEWPAWRDARASGGGAFLEVCSHQIDLCRYLLREEVEQVSAASAGRELVDQNVAITARTDGGALISLVAGQRAADTNEVEVHGRDATLSLSLYRADSLVVRPGAEAAGGPVVRLRHAARAARRLPAAVVAIRRGGVYVDSFAVHWSRVAAAARGDASPPATVDDGVRALAVALAAIESADRGVVTRPEEIT